MGWGLRVATFALSSVLALGCVPSGGGDGSDGPNEPVDEPPPAELVEGLVSIDVSMRPDYDLVVGLPRDFFAEGTYEDGTTRDLSADVTWSASDPDVLSFDDPEVPNRATVERERQGQLVVTASLGDVAGEMTIGDGCEYPPHTSNIVTGAHVPPLAWDNAVLPGGARGDFNLRDVYCGEAQGEAPEIYVFVLGTLWCGACIYEMQQLAMEADALAEAGGQFVFVAVENLEYAPASTDEAFGSLGGLPAQAPVVVGGDADTGAVIGGSGAFSALPSVFIVRTRDMMVIADTGTGAGSLDFTEVAADPDAGWENPPPPMVESNCMPGQEGAEPNNGPAEATVIGPGTVQDGICDAYADFFMVDIDGPWQATVDFQHDVGNLDLYAWDSDADAPLRADGQVVGSFGVTDGEVLQHNGPTIIRVGGFRFESAPYTLTVEAL